jgi:hypothetical protein
MIDSINLKYKLTPEESGILHHKFDYQTTVKKESGESWIKYYYNPDGFNYSLGGDFDGNELLTVTGSLPKQLRGNNWLNHKWDKKDITLFYERINDETGIKLDEGKLKYISRFDVGVNLNVPSTAVIREMKELSPSRLNKVLYDSSLYFRNKTRQFRIYDKVKEIEKKSKTRLTGKIITRFESQLQRNRNMNKLNIHTVAEMLNKEQQKNIFYDTYKKILNKELMINYKSNINETLTLNEYSKIRELESVIQEFGDLELYRRHLKSCGYKKSTISRHISKLRKLLIYVRKENLISINKEIEEFLKNY